MGKVKELDKLDKDAKKAVEWLAAEFEYAEKLIAELEEINRETDSKKAEKDAKKAISIFTWIGRGERRSDREEQKVISGLKKLGELLPSELRGKDEELVRQLSVAEGMLVKFASRYAGEIKRELKDVKKNKHLLRGLDNHPEVIAKVQDKLKKGIESNQAILKGEVKPFVDQLKQLAA